MKPQKLRPFFPPLEALQSVNLRAALFRVLSDLKKNGDLGKETILRKSMLDDCKGEKFDELLAVFSTAVLRRILTASIDGRQLNPALRLSLANGISPEEYQLALPLLLAHRASLGSMEERRARVLNTYDKFSQLLDNKKVQLEQRSQENPQSVPEQPTDVGRFAEQVQTNWLGSEEWANSLLHGGSQSSSDAFLELPFAKAWAKAKESTVEDLKAGASRDLLLDLESRVSRQRDRLSRWREYSGTATKGDASVNMDPSPSTNVARDGSVAFRDHQALTVASIAKAIREPENRATPTQQDQSLLHSMNEALARIDNKPRSSPKETKPVSPASAEPATSTLPSYGPSPQEATTTTEPEPQPISPQDDNDQIDPEPSMDYTSPSITLTEDPDTEPRLFALAERTRKSMSLVGPRPSLPPPEDKSSRRQNRMSFPVNQFQTPPKPAPPRAQTPQDQLFEESADYASVFKSRPRIAQSPVTSPVVHVNPLGEFDLDAGVDMEVDVDVDVDVDGELDVDMDVDEMRWFGSPSIRRR